MNEITKQPATMPGTLPDDFADAMMAGIANSPIQNVGTGGGKPFLKMAKDGTGFFYGPTNEEVQEGSQWAVNPMSFRHGRVCWIQKKGEKGKKAGEIMDSMARPMPADPGPIDGIHPWSDQGSFELRCLTGTDVGVEVVYVTPSNGGLQAVKTIVDAFQRHFVIDKLHPCPVVVMSLTSYPHPSWGKIYKPVFEIIGWCDMNGNFAGEHAAAPLPPPATAPTRGSGGSDRTVNGNDNPDLAEDDAAPAPASAQATSAPAPRAKKPPLTVIPPGAQPVPPAPAQTGQRRRPTASVPF